MTTSRLFLAPLLLLLVAGVQTSRAADLVLKNGKIVTMDPQTPEVSALAATGDRITALGSDAEIKGQIGPETVVVDLKGRLAIPGFIESHAHFLGIGEAKLQLELMGTGSFEEIVAQVAAAVAKAKPGELIRGRGWHQEKWSSVPEPNVDGLPLHTLLSAVSPENPVVLVHASGHSAMANARAMELCGIDEQTADPEGGQIVRDGNGRPIGVFRETAKRLLSGVGSGAERASARRRAELANEEVLRKGITTFHDAGVSFEVVDLYRQMVDDGSLNVRLWVMLNESNQQLAEGMARYRTVGYGNHHLTVRAIKRLADGALGSHGAWLLEPYADLPSSAGLNTEPLESLRKTARLAVEHGYQLCVHAIGERANRETLNIFEEAYRLRDNPAGLRWRIEHAQHLDPDDIPRFAGLGVTAAMQGIHCTSDAPYVEVRLGETRAQEGAYVWRSLLDSGALVCNGTDAPVEDVDPIECFYATCTRRMNNGSVFYPEQKMTRMEALASYTIAGAQAGFEENLKGSLSLGKLADIAVLSKDILTVPEEEIREARVDLTIVGGKLLYSRLDEGDARINKKVVELCRPLVEEGDALGLVVGVIHQGESSVTGFGRVTFDSDQIPDGETVYEIGSISKVFTGLLLADAVERGAVALDDPINGYLPPCARPPSDESPILLRHLVTHTSGLPRMPDNFKPRDGANPYVDYGAKELHAYLVDYVLNSEPGETYAYSNLGFGLLGDLVCRASGFKLYDDHLVAAICDPLGMADTRVNPTGSMRRRLAAAALSGEKPGKHWKFGVLEGCGAIHSTMNDMLKYAAAQLAPGQGPVSAALRRSHTLLFEPQGKALALSYGWHLSQDGVIYFHNGQTGGFHSILLLDLKQQKAVCILSSSISPKIDVVGDLLIREL